MTSFLARRLVATALILAVVVGLSWGLVELLPGGPGALVEDPRVPPIHRERLGAALGLDRPAGERFLRFAAAAARGDWGVSFTHHRPVTRVLADAIPHTAALALAALLLELGLGVPLGAWAAARPGSRADRALRLLSLALWSAPSFWLALALLIALAIALPVLPAGGLATPGAESWPPLARLADALAHLLLPALALALPAAAATARFTRAALLEIAGEPFVVAARARGLAPLRVLLRHALRPASAPLVEQAGFSTAALLSGALAVEVVFSRPGLGRLAYDALAARDYPVLVAAAASAAAAVLAASFAADLAHAVLDPRQRDAQDRESA
jgi:peptide/nickel transport system permease protein